MSDSKNQRNHILSVNFLYLAGLTIGDDALLQELLYNTVNIQNVCWEYKHIFLYINADIENLVDFSYIPDGSLTQCSDDTDVMVYIGVGLSAAVVFVICLGGFIVYSYIQKKNSREVTRGDNINMNDRAEDVVHGEDYHYEIMMIRRMITRCIQTIHTPLTTSSTMPKRRENT